MGRFRCFAERVTFQVLKRRAIPARATRSIRVRAWSAAVRGCMPSLAKEANRALTFQSSTLGEVFRILEWAGAPKQRCERCRTAPMQRLNFDTVAEGGGGNQEELLRRAVVV